MFLRACSLFLLIASLVLPAASQRVPASVSNRNAATSSLTGSVRTADDKAIADARVEVRDSLSGAVAASGYTNFNGSFEFQNLSAGSFEIVAISGMDETRERVTLQNDMSTVTLRMPRMARAEAGAGATISVAQMKVPEKARDENKKAQEAMQKRDLDKAWKHVTKALEIAPTFAGALTTRGLLELDASKTEAAVADLEKAIQTDAGYGLSFLVLGATYNQLNRFDDAIRALDHGVALMPNYWQGYFELGKAYLGKADLKNAQQQLERCSKQAPADYAPLHLVKANLYLSIKNYPEAMAELEAFLDRDPNNPNSPAARKTLDEVKAFLAKK